MRGSFRQEPVNESVTVLGRLLDAVEDGLGALGYRSGVDGCRDLVEVGADPVQRTGVRLDGLRSAGGWGRPPGCRPCPPCRARRRARRRRQSLRTSDRAAWRSASMRRTAVGVKRIFFSWSRFSMVRLRFIRAGSAGASGARHEGCSTAAGVGGRTTRRVGSWSRGRAARRCRRQARCGARSPPPQARAPAGARPLSSATPGAGASADEAPLEARSLQLAAVRRARPKQSLAAGWRAVSCSFSGAWWCSGSGVGWGFVTSVASVAWLVSQVRRRPQVRSDSVPARDSVPALTCAGTDATE